MPDQTTAPTARIAIDLHLSPDASGTVYAYDHRSPIAVFFPGPTGMQLQVTDWRADTIANAQQVAASAEQFATWARKYADACQKWAEQLAEQPSYEELGGTGTFCGTGTHDVTCTCAVAPGAVTPAPVSA